jgi:hypothetical protein
LYDWGKEKREIFFDLMINCEEEIKILGYSYIFDLMSNLDHIYYQNITDISFPLRKTSFASQ